MSDSSRPDDEAADGSFPVTDAEWEAFQQQAEVSVRRPSQAGPAPKEPSARARMVTARLREHDEAAAARNRRGRWGRRAKQPGPWQPEGWRTGPGWQSEQRGRPGPWRRPRRVGLVCAVLCLLVGVLWFAGNRSHLDLGTTTSRGGGTPLAAETVPARDR